MKKIEKTIKTVYRLRKLIDWYKNRFGLTHETWDQMDEDEEKGVITFFHPLMVTFYDEHHNKLVSNWLCNSADFSYKNNYYSYWQQYDIVFNNDTFNLSRYFEVDLMHLTWEQPELLSKARYIRVGRRDDDRITEHIEGTRYRSYYIEKGYEAKIHGAGKAPIPYECKADIFEYDTADQRPHRKRNQEEETA